MRNDLKLWLWALSLCVILILASCTDAPVRPGPPPEVTGQAPASASPTPSCIGEGGAGGGTGDEPPHPVEGWVGVVEPPAEGMRSYVFRHRDGGTYPLAAESPVLEARIAQAAGEGTRVQISGLLYGEGASCYLEVSQLDFLAPDFEPTRAPEAVTAWKGVIVRPPGNPRGQVFVRDDGEGYDVGGQGDEVREAVQEALETGARVRIWGTASYGVPASRARHIEITRLEFVSPRE